MHPAHLRDGIAQYSKVRLERSALAGSLSVPSSKSHTLRAILLGSLTEGLSVIRRPLRSPDTEAMIEAIQSLGAKVAWRGEDLLVSGPLAPPKSVAIDAGNSGLVFRLVPAIAALFESRITLTGDASILSRRPIAPLLEGLKQLGAKIEGLSIEGPIRGGRATLEGSDSQPVSALLLAASFAPEPTELFVQNPGETPWIDLTLSWLTRLGLPYERAGYSYYRLPGRGKIAPFTYTVPADLSSASYPIAAALLTDSEITLKEIDMTDVQGDKAVILLLKEMGGDIHIDGERKELTVRGGRPLKGGVIDVNPFIDALPLLATLGSFTQEGIEIVGGKIARFKESDRIATIASELRKMGAKVEEREDGLKVLPGRLSGALDLQSHQDHRIALALATGALAISSPSVLEGIECVNKTYGSFFHDMARLGASVSAGFESG